MGKSAHPWKACHDAGETALEHQEPAEAERMFLSALRAAKKFRGVDQRRLRSLEGLAHVYLMTGQGSLAVRVYRFILESLEEAYGPRHSKLADHLEHFALFFMPSHFSEAEALLRRSRLIRQRAWGGSCPDLALCDVSEAFLHGRHGKLAEAEAFYRRAIRRIENARGSRHPDLVFYLQLLAGFYRAQGRYPEAEPLYSRVLMLVESQPGWGDQVLVNALEDLGRVYKFQGKQALAETLFQRINEIWEKNADSLFSA